MPVLRSADACRCRLSLPVIGAKSNRRPREGESLPSGVLLAEEVRKVDFSAVCHVDTIRMGEHERGFIDKVRRSLGGNKRYERLIVADIIARRVHDKRQLRRGITI